MLALLSKQPGGPETLAVETVPEPQPRADDVPIAVRACGVNSPDVLIIEDRYQYKPERPYAPGSEVSGVVTGVGENVGGFKVGDRVIGSSPWGGMAEKLAIDGHPLGDEAAVIGVPRPYRGEAAKAFVTLNDGADGFTFDELQGFLADKLGRHEMPAILEFRDSLPRAPDGKLSKMACGTRNVGARERPERCDRPDAERERYDDASTRHQPLGHPAWTSVSPTRKSRSVRKCASSFAPHCRTRSVAR